MRVFRLSRTVVLGVLVTLAVEVDRPAASAASIPSATPEPTWTAEQRQHWAFLAPRRPDLPHVTRSSWVRNPIDAFILHELEALELAPAVEADRLTLIRRLRFDLTGLPPTPEEVDAFVADRRPDAYERLVDRLLESTQYGERWARFWLDLARFAESDGFKSDNTRPLAWRYRDWVIGALNDDMPYDRFVQFQLAGDEVAPGDPGAFIATAFNRHWPFEDNNKVPGLNRQLMLDDVTDTTTSVFLGLTVACARCHDHKYDAISQKDYYRFEALFATAAPKDDFALLPPFEQAVHASTQAELRACVDKLRAALDKIEQPYRVTLMKGQLDKLPGDVRKAFETSPEERTASQDDLLIKYAKQMKLAPEAVEKVMSPPDRRVWGDVGREMAGLVKDGPQMPPLASGMIDTGRDDEPVRLLQRGSFANPAEEVPPGFLSVLGPTTRATDATTPFGTSGRRKALADWLTRPDHPLTARVMVNRIWQNHFGRGLVATPSDFGTQGTAPSHPALLDWFATEFVARGWSLKAMHRLMVTSATYRQSSVAAPESVAADPENIMLGRMPRRRLEGEAVRDALLTVAGQLDSRLGGPSVFPELPPGVETRGGWPRSASEGDRNRRSVYVFVRRNLKYPLFDAFDAPDTNVTCPERNISVNAPQALMLLNSGLVLDQARHLAGRVLAGSSAQDDLGALVRRAYRLGLSRDPRPEELTCGGAFLQEQAEVVSGRDQTPPALPVPMPEGFLPARGAALVDFCHVLVNLNEFVFVD